MSSNNKAQVVASDRSKASVGTDQNRHVPELADSQARPTEFQTHSLSPGGVYGLGTYRDRGETNQNLFSKCLICPLTMLPPLQYQKPRKTKRRSKPGEIRIDKTSTDQTKEDGRCLGHYRIRGKPECRNEDDQSESNTLMCTNCADVNIH